MASREENPVTADSESGVGPSGIAVIIPAYNEADRVGDTVRAAGAIPGVTQVIVVDDGSTDGTAEAARGAWAHRIVRLDRNRGKGSALNAGWRESIEGVLLFLDADLGTSAREGSKLIEPVVSGAADMTVALFPRTGKGGGMGLAVGLARWGIRMLTGYEADAPLSGQRCIRRELLESVGGFEKAFGAETALTIDAIRAGFCVVEIETTMGHRVTGRDAASILHRARQFRDIARTLLVRSVHRNPVFHDRSTSTPGSTDR